MNVSEPAAGLGAASTAGPTNAAAPGGGGSGSGSAAPPQAKGKAPQAKTRPPKAFPSVLERAVGRRINRYVLSAADRARDDTPSRVDGVPEKEEARLRREQAVMASKMGLKLMLPQQVIACACVLMHRFWQVRSLRKYNHDAVVTACLFLAAKIVRADAGRGEEGGGARRSKKSRREVAGKSGATFWYRFCGKKVRSGAGRGPEEWPMAAPRIEVWGVRTQGAWRNRHCAR